VSWTREEVWLDADLLWFGEGAGAPAVAGFVLPPLPRFEPAGLAASRLRREAWKRRRRARATLLMVLPAVLLPPAGLRGGSAAGAGVVLADDPPSLTLRLPTPTAEPPAAPRPKPAKPSDAGPKIEWREATSVGLPWSGHLHGGTQLPVEGPNWVTWNPVTDRVPNAPGRLHGHERTIRTILSVVEAYRAANPRAPRVLIGDISFAGGGQMNEHVSHQSGLDVDVYYPRRDGTLRAAPSPTAVDRRLAQDLLDRFVAAGAQMVFVGYSTGLRGPAKVVIPYPSHENHMHVRFPRRG
jgi:hypothetical protein